MSKLQPKIFPGRLNAKDNKSAIDWHTQNLLAYGSHSHIVIVDPNHLHVLQTLCEHRYNVNLIKWSNDILSKESLLNLSSSNQNNNDNDNNNNNTNNNSENNIIRLASADINGTILIWNVLDGVVLNYLQMNDGNSTTKSNKDNLISDLCWHPEDSNLLLVLYQNNLTCLNVSNSTRIWKRDLNEFTPTKSIQFDPFKSNQLYLSTHYGCIYSVDEIPLTSPLNQHTQPITFDFKFRVQSSGLKQGLSILNTEYYQILQQWLSLSNNSSSINNQLMNPQNINQLNQSTGLSGQSQNTILLSNANSNLSISVTSGGGGNINTGGNLGQSGELIQMLISPCTKNMIYFVMTREIFVIDVSTNQLFGSLQLDRNKANFQHIIIGKDNPNLMFSLHDDSSITSWLRKSENFNTHNYEQLSSSDLLHFQKKSKKKGQPIISIINHPFFEQTLLSITSDGIIWKWDFISEITSSSLNLYSPRLQPLSIVPLNGVIKLAVSGLLETASSPITSLSVYPFYNKGMVCLVAIGTANGTIQIINLSTMKVQKELFIWNHPVFGIKWLSPGRVLCHSYEEQEKNTQYLNFIASVDFRSGRIKEFRKVSGSEPSFIKGIRLSYSRRFLVLLMKDRPFELWETKKFTCLRSFKLFTHIVGLEWLPPLIDSEVELSLDSTKYEQKEQFTFLLQDGTIKCCTIESNAVTLQDVQADLSNQVQSCLALKREFLVSGDANGNIHSWNLVKKKLNSIATHRGAIKKIRFNPSPTSSEILVMFSSGEFGIWDLNLNQRISQSSYLMEREIKAIDIEWAQENHPVIVSFDQCLRVLDSSLSVTNSKYHFQAYSLQQSQLDPTNYLYSPLLLPLNQCVQLKNLLFNYKVVSQLSKSQDSSSFVIRENIEMNNKLLSMIDDSILTDLESRPTIEGSLIVSQFYGDQKEIEFWRILIHSIQKYLSRNINKKDTSFYNSELIQIYNNLPGIVIQQQQQQTPSSILSPIQQANSSNITSPLLMSNLTSSTTTTLSTQTTVITTTVAPTPAPTPAPTTSNILKKPLSSIFGFSLQKSTQSVQPPPPPPPQQQQQQTTTIIQPLSPQTTPNKANSSSGNLLQFSNTNLSTSISGQQQQQPQNPLGVSQVFSSVASQLQSLESSTDGISNSGSPYGSNSPSLYSSLNDSNILLKNTSSISGGSGSSNESILPSYYDILLDSNQFRNLELEKTDYHERKKPDSDLSKKLIERNILLGRTPRAVSLLLDTTPDSPDFYNRALKASLISASISPEYYQSTTKLIAENLIAVGQIDEGIQFLCMIGKSLEACRYLQSADRWYDASKLAKIKLSEEEQFVVSRAWVQHLLQKSQKSPSSSSSKGGGVSYQMAISILLSIGDFKNVIKLLYENQQYDIASLLLLTCIENSVFPESFDSVSFDQSDTIPINETNNNNDDFTFKQLTQIIFKEYGNLLHQLGNIQAAEFYWIKSGKKESNL